uniref:Uncharacterized protein n=1 Tax=Tanacetum cinerariifolium TaxID=118510 RepID=A0A699L8G6_TANCI|nr:hypothetical protein [Tanacetum cinerariifolium]
MVTCVSGAALSVRVNLVWFKSGQFGLRTSKLELPLPPPPKPLPYPPPPSLGYNDDFEDDILRSLDQQLNRLWKPATFC